MDRGWFCFVCNGWFTDATILEDKINNRRISVHCIKKDDKIFNLCPRCMRMISLCSYFLKDNFYFCPVNEMIEEKEKTE